MPTETARFRERSWRYFMPNRFDRYLLTEVLFPFAGGIIFFLFVFLMFQLLRLADIFIVHGVPAAVLGKMIILLLLKFLPVTLPVAFLIAVLIGFGRLSADSELVAMKANGMSLFRLMAPVLAFAATVSIVSLALNLEWVPWGEREFKRTQIKVANTRAVSAIREGTFTSGFFDLLIFAEKVDSRTNRMSRVFIYDEREPKNPVTVVASSGEIIPVKTKSELSTALVLKLKNGSVHQVDLSTNTYQKMGFQIYSPYLKNDEGSDWIAEKFPMIPYRELLERMQKAAPETVESRELRAEYWRRIAVAVSPIVFVLIGIGFGTIRTRAVRASAFLTALVVLIVFWSLQTYGLNANYHGKFTPFICMQLPNFVMAIVGFAAFRRASW